MTSKKLIKHGTKKVTPLERMQAFRAVERKYAIPAHYLEALSRGESSWTSDAITGSFVGLLQVGPMVLDGYNEANKTHITRSMLFEPSINALVCGWQLRQIADIYNRSGIAGLKEDWRSMEWQALLTAGWNSGYSFKAGVMKVAKYLDALSLPVTHARVFAFAKAANGTRHLQNAKKRRWQRNVALRSFRTVEAQ